MVYRASYLRAIRFLNLVQVELQKKVQPIVNFRRIVVQRFDGML